MLDLFPTFGDLLGSYLVINVNVEKQLVEFLPGNFVLA